MSDIGCVWEDCDQQALYCEGHAHEFVNPLGCDITAMRTEIERLRDLFIRYISHVAAEEGTTFISTARDGGLFSDEQILALLELNDASFEFDMARDGQEQLLLPGVHQRYGGRDHE